MSGVDDLLMSTSVRFILLRFDTVASLVSLYKGCFGTSSSVIML